MTATPALPRKKLPIGIQSFTKLRENDEHYYVDKTPIALDLIANGGYYFLSRPRRFGKSLFLDTLKELFEGNQPLFKGLYAEQAWNWDKKHPVVRISFGDGILQNRAELERRIQAILRLNRQYLALSRPSDWPEADTAGDLQLLIQQAHHATGQPVVVLIDEYDKPILDNITNSPVAIEMREGLKNLYSILKGADEHLKFVFITGVSKFSKVSLFSGLNNLKDITLDTRYSAICGYTQSDVETVFAPELQPIAGQPDINPAEMREWYNGYNWLGESVYNPFDLLLFFDLRQIKPFWFETGTPRFLIDLLAQRQVFTPDLGQTVAELSLLSTFDVDTIPYEALMFQAGYLTIDSVWQAPGLQEFTLKYPNREVQASLNDAILKHWVGNMSAPGQHIGKLYRALQANDMATLEKLFHSFFATIPADWHRKNPIAQYEGYWASIFYSYFAATGFDIRLEDSTNHGRIDMTVLFNSHVYVFEFKVVELTPKGKALEQIKANGYADKYRQRGEPMYLIGVEFSKKNRNIVGFEVERVEGS